MRRIKNRGLVEIMNARRDSTGSSARASQLKWYAANSRRLPPRFLQGAITLCLIATLTLVLQHAGAKALKNQFEADGFGEYRLGPLDKIRIKVFEWRPARDEIFGWSALNADYTVGSSGKLAFPLLGDIEAGGLTTAELGKALGEQLRERMGLAQSPDTSIEVVEYRPIYVVGDIEKPGEYPYRPGLTVLKAMTLGGGLARKNQLGFRPEREAIASYGELKLLNKEIVTLMVRKTRLEAELAGANSIASPPTLTKQIAEDSSVRELLDQERSIFAARNEAFRNQMTTLEQLKDYLGQEAESLRKQIENHDRQIELVKQEFGGVNALAAKGLVTTQRKLSLERGITQMDSDRMRLSTSLVKANQEISRTAVQILELRNKRTNDLHLELQQTQFKLREAIQKANTTTELLNETQTLGPRLLMDDNQSIAAPVLTVVRHDDGRSMEFVAAETTLIRPGDTVKVEVPRPQRKLARSFGQ